MAVYAHPDDAEVACAGTLAAWAEAGCEVTVVSVASGDKGGAVAGPRAGRSTGRARPERPPTSSVPWSWTTLGRADGEFENDVALRSELVEAHPRCPTRGGADQRPDRGVPRRLRQPPRPPGRGLGRARRGRARGRQRLLLPRRRPAPSGGRAAPVGHPRAELVGRHRRHPRPQDRRAGAVTGASSSTRWRSATTSSPATRSSSSGWSAIAPSSTARTPGCRWPRATGDCASAEARPRRGSSSTRRAHAG